MSENIQKKFVEFANFCLEHGGYIKNHLMFGEKWREISCDIEKLESRCSELEREHQWIPVGDPPNEPITVLLADFDSAVTYGCGIPATTGFYFRGEWHVPTGSGVSPTHYKDCIIDNKERGGSESAHARWSDNFPKSGEALKDENEQKWVSVKDRLPSAAHTTVITLSEDGYVRPADYYRYLSEWRVLYKGNPVLKHVTHWMPLPAPPEDTDEA